MPKTVVIYDSVHQLVMDKRKEIIQKHGFDIQIRDIINSVVKNNISKFDVEIIKERI